MLSARRSRLLRHCSCQALVGRVRLGREDQVGQLVLQATAGHGLAVPADLPRRMTVTQVQASSEQLGHATWKVDGSSRRGRRHLVGTPQQVVEALGTEYRARTPNIRPGPSDDVQGTQTLTVSVSGSG